ncbi:hypothetical protein ACTXT7_006060 [Hymenolepis weldensis]
MKDGKTADGESRPYLPYVHLAPPEAIAADDYVDENNPPSVVHPIWLSLFIVNPEFRDKEKCMLNLTADIRYFVRNAKLISGKILDFVKDDQAR